MADIFNDRGGLPGWVWGWLMVLCILAAGSMLTGCGESVSEHHANEKRDLSIRRADNDVVRIDSRIDDLEARVGKLEEANASRP